MKSYRIEKSDRYSWYHPTGTEFRIDNTFVSPRLGASSKDVSAIQDSELNGIKYFWSFTDSHRFGKVDNLDKFNSNLIPSFFFI